MEENTPKKFKIFWILALILVLFLAIQLIFAMLGRVIGKPEPRRPDPAPAQSVSDGLPELSYCPYCGEKLPESFQWGQFCPFCGEKTQY